MNKYKKKILNEINMSLQYSIILSEITSIIGTRFMENERMLNKAEADNIVNDSIIIIKEISLN